jgi:hypothetical protein
MTDEKEYEETVSESSQSLYQNIQAKQDNLKYNEHPK